MALNSDIRGKTFWLVGFDDARSQELKETISKHGGYTTSKPDSEVNYCIATPAEKEQAAKIVNEVLDYDVPVLEEAFIWKSIAEHEHRKSRSQDEDGSGDHNDDNLDIDSGSEDDNNDDETDTDSVDDQVSDDEEGYDSSSYSYDTTNRVDKRNSEDDTVDDYDDEHGSREPRTPEQDDITDIDRDSRDGSDTLHDRETMSQSGSSDTAVTRQTEESEGSVHLQPDDIRVKQIRKMSFSRDTSGMDGLNATASGHRPGHRRNRSSANYNLSTSTTDYHFGSISEAKTGTMSTYETTMQTSYSPSVRNLEQPNGSANATKKFSPILMFDTARKHTNTTTTMNGPTSMAGMSVTAGVGREEQKTPGVERQNLSSTEAANVVSFHPYHHQASDIDSDKEYELLDTEYVSDAEDGEASSDGCVCQESRMRPLVLHFHPPQDTLASGTAMTRSPSLHINHADTPTLQNDRSTGTGERRRPIPNERLQWQTMLTSVLTGDVIRSEKQRLSNNTNARQRAAEFNEQIWLGLRAIVRGRSIAEERRFVMEARSQVDALLEEVIRFRVDPSRDALEQVTELLQSVDVVERLWPSRKAIMTDRPLYGSVEFQQALDTLNSWCTVTKSLQIQLQILRSWTGSETLEVNIQAHNFVNEDMTNSTDANANTDPQTANLTFLDRLLKENGLQRIFEKSTIASLNHLLKRAKEEQVRNAKAFADMGLPPYSDELAMMIAFPVNLMEQVLRLRLDYLERLSGFTMITMDQILEDTRTSLELACHIKMEASDLSQEVPGWSVPSCVHPSYDREMMRALKFFFRLLSQRLRSDHKAIYFKEAEILESEWSFLSKICQWIEGGEKEIAQQISNLQTRLLTRVIAYCKGQVQVPPSEPDGKLVSWYTRVLDSVRLRTRRLYRFSRNVHTRLENSTEYLYAPQNQLTLSNALSSNGYYLYYTDYFEKRGMYLIVPPAMACRPEHVKHILNRCFIMPKSADSDVHVEDRYVLLIASKGFTWEGPVVHVPIVNDDISVKPNRIRLVTEHGHMLNACHRKFMQHAAACELQRVSLQRPNLCCINAHYQKVKRAAFYLGQTLIKSTAKIRCLTVGQEGHADLIQSWHTFTADYVERIIRHVDPVLHDIMSQDLMRLSIHWVTFLCEDCDQNDRKTFRWVVNALETTMSATADDNILRLTPTEFAHLRRMVAGCMTLLITHVDVHGARGSFEARAAELERRQALENVMFSESSISKRAWRTASIRRSAHPSGTTTPEGSSAGAVPLDESKLSPLSSTSENNLMYYADDSSLMYVRDEWLRQIKELEQRYAEKQRDSRLIGRVLDDDRPETRDLVFLASSSSNISLRWQQGKYIGGGTFGSVYLGINMDSGALMAVKEVRFQDASSLSSAYRGVRDEMAVLERLCHPNIVSYYGIEVHRDKVYIFMEYCQGGTLATLLEHGRIEDEDLIRVYAAQMLRGVAYLHANNIVHRDIKPDNILFDEKGNIKFVDFGAAKMIANNPKTLARTLEKASGMNMGSLAGTPAYMAPEVVTGGAKGRKGAQDIWAIGCCILEMATGHRPWYNLDNEWAIMFHVATGRPHLPEPSQLSEAGIDFLRACFNRSATSRATAEELLKHPWLKDVDELETKCKLAERIMQTPAKNPLNCPPSKQQVV